MAAFLGAALGGGIISLLLLVAALADPMRQRSPSFWSLSLVLLPIGGVAGILGGLSLHRHGRPPKRVVTAGAVGAMAGMLPRVLAVLTFQPLSLTAFLPPTTPEAHPAVMLLSVVLFNLFLWGVCGAVVGLVIGGAAEWTATHAAPPAGEGASSVNSPAIQRASGFAVAGLLLGVSILVLFMVAANARPFGGQWVVDAILVWAGVSLAATVIGVVWAGRLAIIALAQQQTTQFRAGIAILIADLLVGAYTLFGMTIFGVMAHGG